jgi:hypothetical protein
MDGIQKSERISSGDIMDESSTELVSRKEHHGVTLIPRPSEDPLDPLVSRTFAMAKLWENISNFNSQNWPISKRIKILAVISFATFTGFAACLAGQLQVVPQSKLYKVTTNQMAYQVRPIIYNTSQHLKLIIYRTLLALQEWLLAVSSFSHYPT